MSETPVIPTEPVAPAATVEATPVEDAVPEPDLAAEAAKWKAMARKHEGEAKSNADKAKRLDALEAANRTEIEKAQAVAETNASEAAELRAELARAKAAITHGLDADDLEALDGVPADKVDAIAARLAAKRSTQTPRLPSANGQGNVGTPIAPSGDPIKELDAQILDATKAGNFLQVINLKEQRSALLTAKP